MSRLKKLAELGQSPWFDNISRRMIDSGELKRLIDEDGLRGVTSNPSIFDKAISGSSDYDGAIESALASGKNDAEDVFEALAVADIRDACDALKQVHASSEGADGFVSLEVSPRLARDTKGTVAAGKRLAKAVGRPNLMIKVPATKEGLPAITELLAAGVSVNVTLIFHVDRYAAVLNAYLTGMEKLEKSGADLSKTHSVASFFVSRIDSAVDALLPKDSPLRGRAAVMNARRAYEHFLKVRGEKRWKALAKAGAKIQRPLWASTSTKDPSYPDTLYVDELIGPDTVNTIPPATWTAFLDHGKAARTVDKDLPSAWKHFEALEKAGIDFAEVADELETAGVDAFAKSYESLLASLAQKTAAFLKKKPSPSPAVADLAARLWAKDASLWKSEASHKAVINDSLGWLRMPQIMPDRLVEILGVAEEIRAGGFKHVVVLGMGGSSLAPEVFRRVFGRRKGWPELHVLDSTDPEAVAAVEKAAPPKDSYYIVASKSGSTVEPARMLDYFYGRLKAYKSDGAGKHFAAVTDPGSPLVDQANALKFGRVFLNFADIGGRYSALSYFGIVPAALMGADVRLLLERAQAMAKACAPESRENPGLALGAALGQYWAKGRDKVTLLAPPEIESFGLWLEQLVAESTGKENKGVVPVALEPARKAADYAQDRVFVRLRLADAKDPFEKLCLELEKKGHPVITLHLADVYDIGAEFFRWEIATAVLGHRLGINPFDQPNVQTAKEKAKVLMAELKKHGELPKLEALCSEDSATLSASKASAKAVGGRRSKPTLDAAVAAFFAAASEGDYAAVLPYLNPDGSYEKELCALRAAVAGFRDLAVQMGYGPRYLHSTGQLHKGGANNGLFLVISREGGPDLEIPGAGHTFGQLVRAQALGDFQALEEAGCRALFLSLKGDPKKGLARLTRSVEAAVKAAAKA